MRQRCIIGCLTPRPLSSYPHAMRVLLVVDGKDRVLPSQLIPSCGVRLSSFRGKLGWRCLSTHTLMRCASWADRAYHRPCTSQLIPSCGVRPGRDQQGLYALCLSTHTLMRCASRAVDAVSDCPWPLNSYPHAVCVGKNHQNELCAWILYAQFYLIECIRKR